jgi:hypothetical protein|tara:strand:+ start:336 stop:1283 length:948 start_codon:yes stop_codon:yes gene_type:complete
MRKIPQENLKAEKNNKNKKSSRGKTMFGYNVLGFGSGGGVTLHEGDYLVLAGGGGGQFDVYGTGGAGGYRTSFGCGPEASGVNKLKFQCGETYAVTVGSGGAGMGVGTTGAAGQNSTLANFCGTFTATGGGGAQSPFPNAGGGSGGGEYGNDGPTSRNNGNAGCFTPVEGHDGSVGNSGAGGGGGAGEDGDTDGNLHGGDGLSSSITGSSATRGGGGGGGGSGSPGPGGSGGGGGGGPSPGGSGGSGGANQGGGGGSGGTVQGNGGAGGSGVVILRFPACNTLTVSPGTNSVASCVGPSNCKVATFNVSGCLTVT